MLLAFCPTVETMQDLRADSLGERYFEKLNTRTMFGGKNNIISAREGILLFPRRAVMSTSRDFLTKSNDPEEHSKESLRMPHDLLRKPLECLGIPERSLRHAYEFQGIPEEQQLVLAKMV